MEVLLFLLGFVACWVGFQTVAKPFFGVRRRLFSTFLLEHIGVLTRLGMPLVQGLMACQSGLWRGSMRDLTATVDRLSEGHLLGDALALAPKTSRGLSGALERLISAVQLEPAASLVSPAEAEVLRVGEMTGNLSGAVSLSLAERRRSLALRASLYASLTYAVLLAVVVLGLFGSASIVILPRLEKLFQEITVELPRLTSWLVSAARERVYVWGLLLFAVLVLLGRLKRFMGRGATPRRRVLAEWWQRLVFLVPPWRGILQRQCLGEFRRELAMLLRVGVPAPRALRVIAEGTLNPWFRDRVRRAAHLCEQGADLASALAEAAADPDAAWLARAMRNPDDLCLALSRLADDASSRCSLTLAVLARLAPAVIVLTVGAVVAVFCFGVMLPLVAAAASLMG